MICSIIIRSYNEERHIGRLIIGIQKQRIYNSSVIEIILVDSGSTDSTVSIAKKLGAKVIEIPKEEFSFGRALNIGCASARGSILLFVSAHVYPVYNDWLEIILNCFDEKNVGLVYGRQIGNEITKFSEHQVFRKWFPSISNYNQDHPFCNNANCAVRKNIWEVQNYDETITGLEDLEWAQKLLLKKYKIIYEANAVIVHVHEETYEKIKNRYRREAIALKKIMPKVNFSFIDFVKLFLYNSLSDILQAFREKNNFIVIHQIILFRFMQFYGTYLGHSHKPLFNDEIRNLFYYPAKVSNRIDIIKSSNGNSTTIDYNNN